jgi:D-alanyl-D-alanine carboxypeptidase/D-alanyl-D-alanine-endopeptidase (penicillin-binding protein 4)
MKHSVMRASLAIAALASCSGADLTQRLDALIENNRAMGFAGIHVVDLANGKVLYRRNEDHLFLPASNLKLFTTALALERLGVGYRFATRVIRDRSGDLLLAGSGDPSLSGRVFPYQKDAAPAPPLQAIENLADQAVASGILRVDGDIVGDDRLYPWDPYPPSWTQDDAIRDYGAPVSALTVNDNVVTVSIAPGLRAGEPASLSLSPVLEYLTLDNRVLTSAAGAEAGVHLRRVPGSPQWLLTGSVPVAGAPVSEIIPVDDPALYAASALYDALIRRGVVIRGRAVARHRPPGQMYSPPEGDVIATRMSPPLEDILQVMDKVSQNLYAELILREVARAAGRDGAAEAGLVEMTVFLNSIRAAPGDWRLEDGSGLSRNAMVTPRLITRLLAHVHGSKNHELWMSLLPVGGQDGTLDHRLCCFSSGQGIRAKTGSLARGLALSGYAESKAHGTLAFSILVNNFSAPPAAVRQWIDKLATALLE